MNNWVTYKFEELGKTYGGLTNKTIDDFGSGNPYIPYLNIFENAKIDPNYMDLVQIKSNEKQNKVKYGDLFFTTSSETPNEVGMTSVLLHDLKDTYLNSFCFGFRLHSHAILYPSYAAYLFRSDHIRKTISDLAQGSTRYNLSKSIFFNKLFLRLPTPPHQRKIAKILSTVDAVIEKTEQAILKYKAIKQGMMHDLFTRGIDTHTGKLRPSYEQAPHLYKKTELGWIPKEWDVKRFEQICLKISDRDHFTPTYFETGIPIISPKDFGNHDKISFSKCKYISLEAHLHNSKKTDLKTNDLVFTRIGALLGKVCIVEDWMPEFSILHSACMIRSNDKIILPKLLVYFIKSDFLQRQIKAEVQSIGVPDLGLDKINAFKSFVPSDIIEQEMMYKKLDQIEKVILSEESFLDKTNKQKKGLMQDLLTGKVEVKVGEEYDNRSTMSLAAET